MADRAEATRAAPPWPTGRRMLGWALGCLIVVLVLVAPIPAFVVTPGPVFSLADRIVVDGREAGAAVRGDYLFTTIALEDAHTHDLVRGWFDPQRRVAARTRFIPVGTDEEAFVAEQQSLFRASTAAAARAAAEAAGVEEIEVEVTADEVGGPSAGLVTALAAYDVIADVDLAAGRRIGGTGEVQADGDLVDVGSIGLKVDGALQGGVELFLVPSDQADAARAALPADATMEVVAVDTLQEAIDALVIEEGSRTD